MGRRPMKARCSNDLLVLPYGGLRIQPAVSRLSSKMRKSGFMKRVAFLAFALTLLASLSLGQPAGSLEFDGYPAVAAKKTANAIDFRNSPGAWNFRTRLREAIKGEVNFAGRYILTGWGCGTGCSQMAIIDAQMCYDSR
jgi:hypothetical protein